MQLPGFDGRYGKSAQLWFLRNCGRKIVIHFSRNCSENNNTRRGRRSGGCRFGGRSSGGGEDRPYSSSPGRRSALTKFLSPCWKGAKPFWRTTPAGGGGPAGAVSVVNLREEVKA